MGQQRRKHGTALLPFLQLPGAFLAQLLSGQYLDSSSKLACFCSCRTLRNVVQQHSACTKLHLQLLHAPPLTTISALSRASKHSQNINLHPSGISLNHNDIAPLNILDEMFADAAWQLLKAGKQLGVMNTITSLTLQGALLDTLLPCIIAEACPNLTGLTLMDCTLHWGSAPNFTASLPKLQTLQLLYMDNSAGLGPWKPQLQRQLASLTALRDLVIRDVFMCDTYDGLVYGVAQHITCLHVEAEQLFHMQHGWAPLATALKRVHLRTMMVNDDELQLLMDVPFLTHVDVEQFGLVHSHAGQPCTWQEVNVLKLTVTALAYLPLHNGLLLKAGSSVNNASFEQLQEAVVNVARSKGLCWIGDKVYVSLYAFYEDDQEELYWEMTLSLVKHVEHVCIDHTETSPFVRAICKFAERRDAFTLSVCFEYEKWNAGSLIALIKSMPAGSTLNLRHITDLHNNLLIQMCCAAPHALTLTVERVEDVADNVLFKRVKRAMQWHGHHNVLLQLQCCPPD